MNSRKTHALSGHAGYPPISILVMSGVYVRIFTTHRFSIRALVNDLRRCNPTFKIVAITDCKVPQTLDYLNFGWGIAGVGIDILKGEFGGYLIPNDGTPEELIRKYRYRLAVNILYSIAANNKREINRNPFVGTKNPDKPAKPLEFKRLPAFISYNDLGENPWDILKWYDGRRLRRTIDAELKEGYVITSERWNDNGEE